MSAMMTLFRGIGLGAGLMYFLDPDRGRRRRAFVRDKANHLLHTTEAFAGTTRRDLSNRTRGVIAEVRQTEP